MPITGGNRGIEYRMQIIEPSFSEAKTYKVSVPLTQEQYSKLIELSRKANKAVSEFAKERLISFLNEARVER